MSRHIIEKDGVKTLVKSYGQRVTSITNRYRYIHVDIGEDGYIEVMGGYDYSNGHLGYRGKHTTNYEKGRALLMVQKGCVIYAESDIDHYILDIKCPEFEYRISSK